MSRKPVTLKDIAQEVGVSINTVSCVLNPRNPGNVKVSSATRTAILKTARRLNYRRNVAAARLVGCQTRTLGVLVSTLMSPMTAPIIDAFEEQAADMGYQCFIGCTRHRGLRKLDYVEQFLSHGIDGLLLTSVWNDPEVEHALRTVIDADMPLAFIDYIWEARPAPLICGNHFQGGQLLAAHLLDFGHRRMAFLCDTGQRHLRSITERVRGVQQVLTASGEKQARLDLLWSPSHRSADFTSAVWQRLEQPEPPTVIICSGDLTAIELMVGLQARGLSVPQDLCVTGYDDLLTPFLHANLHLDGAPLPWRLPLTTVRQPMARIGRKAAEVIIQQVGGTRPEPEHLLDVELVVSESSIPPTKPRNGRRRS